MGDTPNFLRFPHQIPTRSVISERGHECVGTAEYPTPLAPVVHRMDRGFGGSGVPDVRRRGGDLQEAVPFQDWAGVLSRVTVDQGLAQAQSRTCPGGGQIAVEPATTPLLQRRAAPDARELSPGYRLQ